MRAVAAARPAQMCEDALDGCGFFNRSDELQLPATVREVLDVDIAIPTARFNKRAQVMRDCALPAGVCAQSPAFAGVITVCGGTGTTAFRSLAFGASTCSRRLNIDPPCRLNIDPGPVVAFSNCNCG